MKEAIARAQANSPFLAGLIERNQDLLSIDGRRVTLKAALDFRTRPDTTIL